MKLVALSIFTVAAVFPWGLPCACAVPIATAVLPNGMTVTAVTCGASDVCGMYLALAIGPERIPAEKAGLRALTQQILLERMRRELDQRADLAPLRLEGSEGASFTVETEVEHVEFAATITSRQLPLLLGFTASSVFQATWTQDDVVSAREVIQHEEEVEQGLGDPSAQLLFLVRRALVGDSPLAQPIFGTAATRQRISLADVKAYYDAFYVPNLAHLCITGPLPAADVIRLAEKAFGHLPPRDVAPAFLPPVDLDRSRVQIGLNTDIDFAFVIVAFPMPPVGSPDRPLADILYAALSGPRGSLAQAPRELQGTSFAERMGITEPQPFVPLPIQVSRLTYLAVFGRAIPNAVEQVRSGILAAVLRFAQAPLSSEELDRAKIRALHLHGLPMESPQFAATVIGRFAMLGASFPSDEEYATRVEAVTAEELQAFAARQLRNHAVGVLMPGR